MDKVRNEEETGVNRRQLAREIGFMSAAVLAAVAILVMFWLVRTGGERSYEEERSLYQVVLDYDYAKGRDSGLEARLNEATKGETETTADFGQEYSTSETRTFYNYYAKAYYYYRVGQNQTALAALGEAEEYAEEAEEAGEILVLYRDIYAAIGNDKKVEYYEKLLAGDFSEVEGLDLE